MENSEERAVSVLLSAKVFHSLRLRCRRGVEESEVEFVQCMDGTAPSGIIEEYLGCIRLRRSTFDGMDHSVCWRELEGSSVSSVNVAEWN